MRWIVHAVNRLQGMNNYCYNWKGMNKLEGFNGSEDSVAEKYWCSLCSARFLHSPRGKENIFTTAVFRTLPFLFLPYFWMKIGKANYVFHTIFTVCYFIRSYIHTLSILSCQQRNTETDCILYRSAHLTLSMDKNNRKRSVRIPTIFPSFNFFITIRNSKTNK